MEPTTLPAMLVAALLTLLPTALAGQGLAVATGPLAQAYSFDDPAVAGLADIHLVTIPFAWSVPFGSHLAVAVDGAFADGRVRGPEGAEATLIGFTDTRIEVSLGVAGPLVVTGVATVPTGKATHSLEEAAVAGVVAAELLPFAISNWGSGGTVGGDVAFAFRMGAVNVGVSGGYHAARGYEPLAAETFSYRPGDQVRLRLAADAEVGEAGTLSVLLGVQRHGDDQLRDANLFRSGNRLEGGLSYAFPMGLRGSGLLYGAVSHRSDGRLLVEDPTLEGATASPAQQLFAGGVNFRLPLGTRAVLFPDADGRVFRTADGVGQGWVGTAGASLAIRLAGRSSGRRVILTPTARARFGRVTVREGAESDLSGWEAGVTLSLEPGR